MSWEKSKSVFEIRSFLGLAGYYKRCIKDFSRLVTPMTRLTHKEVKYEWNDPCERAFQELKKEAYISSYSYSLGKGTEVHDIL